MPKLTDEQTRIRDAAVSMAEANGYTRHGREWAARPGKFEGESFYTPYFYGQLMDGDGEPLGDGDSTDADLLTVTDDERAAFALKADTAYIAVCYSEQGFVSVRELTEKEAEDLRAEYEEPTYSVSVWEERDRLHIKLTGTDDTDLNWWDDDARQMFEDGFFKSQPDLEESVIEYARERGLLGSQS